MNWNWNEELQAATEEFEKATIHMIFAICNKHYAQWRRGLLTTKEYEKACRDNTRTYRAILGKGTRLSFTDSIFPTIIHSA